MEITISKESCENWLEEWRAVESLQDLSSITAEFFLSRQ